MLVNLDFKEIITYIIFFLVFYLVIKIIKKNNETIQILALGLKKQINKLNKKKNLRELKKKVIKKKKIKLGINLI